MPVSATAPSVFTPYYNEWNRNAYTRRAPFAERPWLVPAGSTSGAAVAVAGDVFVGLTRPCAEAEFRWDGTTFTADAPDDALFVRREAGAPAALDAAWADYHRALALPPARVAPFGRMPEYCTWVEQVLRPRAHAGQMPCERLDEGLVDALLDAVDAHGWPRGRFTVDEGWGPRHGPGGYGTWEPSPNFDPEAVAARVAARGHVPGLWLAPALICPESDAARAHPEAVGDRVTMPGETPWNRFHYLRPGPAADQIIAMLFRRAWSWGYRKFKLDILYGSRLDMLALHASCRRAADALSGPVELEGHVPDPFAAAHADTIRLNDVMVSAAHPRWRSVAEGHYEVCARSAPGHLLCLDHIGGNAPGIAPAEFVAHADMLAAQLPRGYPVVGMLPDRFGPEAVAAVTRLIAPAPISR